MCVCIVGVGTICERADIQLCIANIRYRMNFGGAKIPTVAVHMFYKRLEPPTASEGTVVTIDGTLNAPNRSFDHTLRFVWR